MSTFYTISQMAMGAVERMTAARRRRRTIASIEMLPQHILKDIGWPAERRPSMDPMSGRS